MNMNNDDFFNDIQDDMQDSEFNKGQTYQSFEQNKKNKLLLTVIISFVMGLFLLALFLVFISGKKDEDMVSIGSYEKPVFPEDKNLTDANAFAENNRGRLNAPAVVQTPVAPALVAKPVVPAKKLVVKPVVVKPVAPVVVAPKVDVKPVAPKGIWKVQLMSAQDKENKPEELKVRMEGAWEKLVSGNPVLKTQSYEIEKTNIKGADWYRLRVVGLMNSEESTKLCDQLKLNKVDCVLVK